MKLKYGIASPSTITRMLCGIDEELALYAFMEWVGEIVDSRNTHLAVDGKALCGATEKTKGETTPMLLNVVETVRGLMLAQLPVDSKTNEITVIPELLKLLDISGSIVTIDAVGTQTAIMEQIHEQGGHFALTVKKNQPEAYEEIHTFMDKLEAADVQRKKGEVLDSGMREYLEKYEEIIRIEKNRDRNEYRTCQICKDASNLTKSQKEWPHVQSIGRIKQVRIPSEKDSHGNDVTPSKEEFLEKEPQASPFFRHYMMGKDFIDRKPRYCIWLVGADPSLLKRCPLVRERIDKVREFRMASTRNNTRKAADTPGLFASILEYDSPYIAIPKVSSQNRRYIPMDYLDGEIIPGDKLFTMPSATSYEFGILMSNVHMAWTRVVCGRLKSDYSYSNTIVYNNFPWPSPTDEQKEKIKKTAQAILNARALYPNSSLADLYDPLTMPPELLKAHNANNRAVMEAYGFSTKMSEADCVAELMKMYQKLTEEK